MTLCKILLAIQIKAFAEISHRYKVKKITLSVYRSAVCPLLREKPLKHNKTPSKKQPGGLRHQIDLFNM